MRRFLFCFGIAICMSSCATLINKSHYDVLFSSDKQNTSVTIHDSTYSLPAKINLKRDKKQLEFTVKTDSLSKNFTLYPYTDGKIATNASLGPFMAAGFAVDLLSKQRFTYGKFVNIATSGDSICVYGGNERAFGRKNVRASKQDWNSIYGIRKGEIYFSPEISPITAINISDKSGDFAGISFFSARLNLDYAYANDRYLSIGTGFVAPLNSMIFFDFKYANAFLVKVSDNFVWERFHFGYGLGFVAAHHKKYRHDFGQDEDVYLGSFSNNSLTGNLELGIRTGRRFFFKIDYQPSIFRLSPDSGFAYGHLLSFGFTYKLRLRKEK